MENVLEQAKAIIDGRKTANQKTDFLVMGKSTYETANAELSALTNGQIVKVLHLYGIPVVVLDAYGDFLSAGILAE